MQWQLQNNRIADSAEVLHDILLENRKIASKDQASFFSPRSPLEFTFQDVGIDPVQMSRAINRVLQAKESKELVIVFGDYDADGVCSTTILWEALYGMGVKAIPFIPHREKHGYGMSPRALKDLLEQYQPGLVITVDNGIVAHEAVNLLNNQGIDVIITDHHQPETKKVSSEALSLDAHFPAAYAIVHSTVLCGTTVAWFLARELNRSEAEQTLDLCAIATIADQMKLLGPSRSFAKWGIEQLRKTTRIGLQTLYDIAEIQPEKINTHTINYVIAPRINAMGRLSSAMDALRALCTKQQTKARELMKVLHQTNQDRQALTSLQLDEALSQAQLQLERKVLVVSSETFHEGVIGLVAGKLVETFGKPSIVISTNTAISKASARSVTGVNIVELIRLVREDLIDVGGHPMAAGFSVHPEKIEIVRTRLFELADRHILPEQLDKSLPVECEIDAELISVDTAASLNKFQPWGNGNPEPILAIKRCQILEKQTFGSEGQHLKLFLKAEQSRKTFEAVGFHLAELALNLEANTSVNIAGCLSINVWKNREKIQIFLKDVS